ncbi:MAG: T9SS type A sorting domain-containing protein [Calditrichaeota bacterium]|nr:T9SS type A sorting domain-containing protein [Calditrichota bacterium]
MKRVFATISVFLLLATTVQAQFQVVSSSPADGAVNVPTSTTISFTFSDALDATFPPPMLPVRFAAISPKDSIQIDSVYYSADFKTLYLDVTQTPNTDVVFILSWAISANGDTLAHPFALNYTTAATHGDYTISGTIIHPDGDATNTIVIITPTSVFEEDTTDSGAPTILSSSVVLNATGNYTVNYVRNGTYWVTAVYDANRDGFIEPESGDYIGFYDADGDGMEDSVVVQDGNLTGIDITLVSFSPYTARQLMDSARALARQIAQDQKLLFIGSWVDSVMNGRSFYWYFIFYSPTLGYYTEVTVGTFGVQIDTSDTSFIPSDALEIPTQFIDSDSVFQIVEQAGGALFRQQYDVYELGMQLGNFYWAYPDDPTKILWYLEYKGFSEADSTDATFSALVDASDGTVLSTQVTSIDDQPTSSLVQQYRLDQNYPNPFNPATTIRFSIPRSERVTLKVYDVTGREVVTLIDGRLRAGTHRVTFNATDLPSGVYFYQLRAGKYVATRKMILIK